MRHSRLTLSFAATWFLAGCAAPPPLPGNGVRLPDGRRIVIGCTGKGSPTVLLDAGWGAGRNAWTRIAPAIGRDTRVCAYDRAGTGESDPGPLPRDGKAVARDLARTLHAARIDGPYILVGHSIGAIFARALADRIPRKVAGMVLIDGTVEFQQRQFESQLGPGHASLAPIIAKTRACLDVLEAPQPVSPPERCQLAPPATDRWRNRLSELEELSGATSIEISRGRQAYGDMPLITLTAANTYKGDDARVWLRLHQIVASRSSRGESRLVEGSGHLMMKDAPDVVIQAIREVVVASRERLKGRKLPVKSGGGRALQP